jgi:glycosyltransferase involved in cell wall biosynthesis
LKYILDQLIKQVGIKELEIILVDSGSTDGSIQNLPGPNIKVIKIPSQKFSHSYARNLGVKQAKFETILFLTQDAIPPNEQWLSSFLAKFQTYQVSAATCSERKRPGDLSDLHNRVDQFCHYEKLLKLGSSDQIYSIHKNNDPTEIRKGSSLNNVACLYKKSVLKKFKFRGNFAEDLDLGYRLIQKGHKTAILGSIHVLHSHNRRPSYNIKRAYISTTVGEKIFPGQKFISMDIDGVIPEILSFYNYICANKKKFKLGTLKNKTDITNTLNSVFNVNRQTSRNFELSENNYNDSEFFNFLTFLKQNQTQHHLHTKHIQFNFLARIKALNDYIQQPEITVEEITQENLFENLIKMFADSCGFCLGNSYLNDRNNNLNVEIRNRLSHSV